MAHPDHFDANALLAYAVSNDREDELYESGCGSIRELHGLGQTQVGLWKLPSTRLFEDFCVDEVAGRLEHDYIRGTAVDLIRRGGGGCGGGGGEGGGGTDDDGDDEVTATGGGDGDGGAHYIVTLADGTEIYATSVVLALGPTGTPVIPAGIANVPNDKLVIPWRLMNEKLESHHKSVLVVGGGLTAVQAAQHCLRRGMRVILCSRRPLVERHFDLHECWFDKRRANGRVSDFYHRPASERLDSLRTVRGGGERPPDIHGGSAQVEEWRHARNRARCGDRVRRFRRGRRRAADIPRAEFVVVVFFFLVGDDGRRRLRRPRVRDAPGLFGQSPRE